MCYNINGCFSHNYIGIDGLTGNEFNLVNSTNSTSDKIFVNNLSPWVTNACLCVLQMYVVLERVLMHTAVCACTRARRVWMHIYSKLVHIYYLNTYWLVRLLLAILITAGLLLALKSLVLKVLARMYMTRTLLRKHFHITTITNACTTQIRAYSYRYVHKRIFIYKYRGDFTNASMCGFVELESSRGNKAQNNYCDVMSMFTPDRIPIMSTLAQEFALFDRFFAAFPGPTWYVHHAHAHARYRSFLTNTYIGMRAFCQ